MKKKPLFLLAVLMTIFNVAGFSQTPAIKGAWESKDGEKVSFMIFQDGYFTHTKYSANEFSESWGGPYSIKDKKVEVSVEFNSANAGQVGSNPVFSFSSGKDWVEIYLEANPVKYYRIDNGNASLAGVWKITARESKMASWCPYIKREHAKR